MIKKTLLSSHGFQIKGQHGIQYHSVNASCSGGSPDAPKQIWGQHWEEEREELLLH